MNFRKIVVFLFMTLLLLVSSLASATNWWDVQNVQHLKDGSLVYSIRVDEYMNKKTGDTFSGIVNIKYGNYEKYTYIPTRNTFLSLNLFGGSIISVNGTINGKDVSSIPIYSTAGEKHVIHDEKCKFKKATKLKEEKLPSYDEVMVKKGVEYSSMCGCHVVMNYDPVPVINNENSSVWNMITDLNSSRVVYISRILFDEAKEYYWRPNMFNGNYIYNGRMFTIDAYTEEAHIKKVSVYPVESVYSNSSIFEIYDNVSKSICIYRVFKEKSIYKVQKASYGGTAKDFFTLNYLGNNNYQYVKPNEELISYGEAIAEMLGIKLEH